MKNVILGMIGCYMSILVLCAGISIYARSSRQNEISNAFSSVMKQALEKYYVMSDMAATYDGWDTAGGAALGEKMSAEEKAQLQEKVQAFLEDEMRMRITSDSDVFVEIRLCDMEKGILSASVRSEFVYPTGSRQVLSAEKTVLYDREVTEHAQAEVVFCVDGEVYKTYRITLGEPMILPKAPQKDGAEFFGWQNAGDGTWYGAQNVTEDTVWNAVFH